VPELNMPVHFQRIQGAGQYRSLINAITLEHSKYVLPGILTIEIGGDGMKYIGNFGSLADSSSFGRQCNEFDSMCSKDLGTFVMLATE